MLTHWGRATHISVGKLTIIGSDNGLSPGRRQAIIWTNAGIFLIWPLGTNFNEISIKIITFSFTKMRLKVSSAKWRPFCLGLNVLKCILYHLHTSVLINMQISEHMSANQRVPVSSSTHAMAQSRAEYQLFEKELLSYSWNVFHLSKYIKADCCPTSMEVTKASECRFVPLSDTSYWLPEASQIYNQRQGAISMVFSKRIITITWRAITNNMRPRICRP